MNVLLGDPSFFKIKAGANPHTRDRFGRRKKVDLKKAISQWQNLKGLLESHRVKVHVLAPVEEEPGLVFPANAGFRYGENFYLSNLNPSRAKERPYYEQAIVRLGLEVKDLPEAIPFEGEADFFSVGDPSGDPKKEIFLFTYGRIERQRWNPRFGFPPYRRIYGFRSDRRILKTLQGIVQGKEVLPLELIDEAHYHGDTALCPFGPRREFLLAYLPVLSPNSQATLRARFGDRIVALKDLDGRLFAANSFQITTEYHGQKVPILLLPDGLTDELYRQVRQKGVIPCPVDTSEFLEKGGGAVKCLLLHLGEI